MAYHEVHDMNTVIYKSVIIYRFSSSILHYAAARKLHFILLRNCYEIYTYEVAERRLSFFICFYISPNKHFVFYDDKGI